MIKWSLKIAPRGVVGSHVPGTSCQMLRTELHWRLLWLFCSWKRSIGGITVLDEISLKKQNTRKELYQSNLTLLEVSSSVIINQHQTEVVSSGEFLVDVFESGSEVESAEKETDWNGFASNRCPVHDFEFRDGLWLIVLVWRSPGGFSTNDRQFHVFDL